MHDVVYKDDEVEKIAFTHPKDHTQKVFSRIEAKEVTLQGKLHQSNSQDHPRSAVVTLRCARDHCFIAFLRIRGQRRDATGHLLVFIETDGHGTDACQGVVIQKRRHKTFARSSRQTVTGLMLFHV